MARRAGDRGWNRDLDTGTLAAIGAFYVALLFAVAWSGDRLAERRPGLFDRPLVSGLIFCLGIAVYNTSWSFHGSVGRAAETGWGFLPIYLAPVLILTLGRPLLRRMLALADAQGATSISDFIAGRYGASQRLAAVVTVGSLIGVLPYIALQLQAVGASFDMLRAGGSATGASLATSFWIAAAMAVFIIVFGVRHSHRSGRHRGLMIAVAFDSLVKLAAFLGVAAFIILRAAPDGLDLSGLAAALPAPDLSQPLWLTNTLIAALSFLCLPQLFHILAVERNRPSDLKIGAIGFPLYLLALALPMLPVALVGTTLFGGTTEGDGFMLLIPMRTGAPEVAVLAFVGGLSAATGMVIVATVSLATMLCNDVVMPVLLRTRAFGQRLREADVPALLIAIRRLMVALVLLLAFAMQTRIANYRLSEMGFVSFVAVAQFGPALIAGLFLARATAGGAIAGVAAGFTVWAWLLLAPAVWRPPVWLDPISDATLFSLALNTLVFCLVSLRDAGALAVPRPVTPLSEDALRAIAMRFVGAEAADLAFARLNERQGPRPKPGEVVAFTRDLLAGAIGASSARVVMAAAANSGTLSGPEARAILDDASDALRVNHGLLRTVLDTIPQGICIFDEGRTVEAWNARFLQHLDLPDGLVRAGLPLADLLAHNLARGHYTGKDPRRLLAPDRIGRADWPYVYERERADGAVIEIAFDRLPNGGLVSTYSDVTERHRAAAALRQANERLETRVRERTLALEQASLRAEEANRGKTRFLAAAGHDLLQPLNAARLFVAALEHQLQAGEGQRALSSAANAAAALRSSEVLVHGLMDISAFDTGIVQTSVAAFRLDTILKPLFLELSVLAETAGIALSFDGEDAGVRSDPVLLRRIVQNYLTNALRHAEARRVHLRCRRRGGTVEIQVWDDGRGIEPAHREVIFEEFNRGSGSGGGGTGLGLAIVRRTGALLGHETGLRSRLGGGSCFFVRVPAAADAPVPARAPVFAAAAEAKLRVLCIDDDPRVVEAMSALLRQWGQQVETEPGQPPPEALIVDYHLEGGMTGLDLADRLAALWGRSVPTLLVTADRSHQVRAAAASRGVLLAHKPVPPEALRAFLASAGGRT